MRLEPSSAKDAADRGRRRAGRHIAERDRHPLS
jgi:hypothetical protein